MQSVSWSFTCAFLMLHILAKDTHKWMMAAVHERCLLIWCSYRILLSHCKSVPWQFRLLALSGMAGYVGASRLVEDIPQPEASGPLDPRPAAATGPAPQLD